MVSPMSRMLFSDLHKIIVIKVTFVGLMGGDRRDCHPLICPWVNGHEFEQSQVNAQHVLPWILCEFIIWNANLGSGFSFYKCYKHALGNISTPVASKDSLHFCQRLPYTSAKDLKELQLKKFQPI